VTEKQEKSQETGPVALLRRPYDGALGLSKNIFIFQYFRLGRHGAGQGQFFYSFNLEQVVPPDHLARQIDNVLDLSWVHKELAPYYSHTGRPSIDPVLMIRMLITGYVFAIRSERQLCSEVQVRAKLTEWGSAPSHEQVLQQNPSNTGREADIRGCLLWAMCGRLRVGKGNLHVAGLVGAAMCSAFACGSHDRWP
jgi:transposase-like protein DUF772